MREKSIGVIRDLSHDFVLMALREFTDSRGSVWQVWNVHPTTRYSSPVVKGERRQKKAPHVEPERRRGNFSLTPGLETGWLCFESATEKRRLAPMPSDWEDCAEGVLEVYLAAARPIKRRVIDLPPAEPEMPAS